MAIVELPDLTTLTYVKLEDRDDNYSSSSSDEDYDSSNESKSYTSGTSEKDYEDIIANLREDIIEARRENGELTRIYSSLISDSVKKIGDLTSMISDYAYYK